MGDLSKNAIMPIVGESSRTDKMGSGVTILSLNSLLKVLQFICGVYRGKPAILNHMIFQAC